MKNKYLGLLISMTLVSSCSKKDSCDPDNAVEIVTEAVHKDGFSIDFKPISEEDYLVGRWVFSEAWSAHMGLALEIKENHTFEYWFMSDLKDNAKYPIKGKWSLDSGVLHLSEDSGHLYSKSWVLAESNGVEGLMDPKNVTILMMHEESPDTRFIKKLSADFPDWPIYNYPMDFITDSVHNND